MVLRPNNVPCRFEDFGAIDIEQILVGADGAGQVGTVHAGPGSVELKSRPSHTRLKPTTPSCRPKGAPASRFTFGVSNDSAWISAMPLLNSLRSERGPAIGTSWRFCSAASRTGDLFRLIAGRCEYGHARDG